MFFRILCLHFLLMRFLCRMKHKKVYVVNLRMKKSLNNSFKVNKGGNVVLPFIHQYIYETFLFIGLVHISII